MEHDKSVLLNDYSQSAPEPRRPDDSSPLPLPSKTPPWVPFPGRATIPLGSNLRRVVYTHYLPSFSALRNWGTKGSFRRLSGCGG